MGKVDMGGFKAVVIGDLIDHDASKVQGTRLLSTRVPLGAAGRIQ